MKAITVRDNTGKLVAFGPLGTGYDPGVPEGALKTIEPDYETVYQEYQRTKPVEPTEEERRQESIKHALDFILGDPDAVKKMKDALK
jgi:hypothetical protein